MINNDTLATASIFGISAGVVTEAWSSIIVGALAVGVMQPFFRILFTRLINKYAPSKLDKEYKVREEIKMAYRRKRKSKKKDDYKKKRRKKRKSYRRK